MSKPQRQAWRTESGFGLLREWLLRFSRALEPFFTKAWRHGPRKM
jgi:hypothetical protein